jgi:hypothetical protein
VCNTSVCTYSLSKNGNNILITLIGHTPNSILFNDTSWIGMSFSVNQYLLFCDSTYPLHWNTNFAANQNNCEVISPSCTQEGSSWVTVILNGSTRCFFSVSSYCLQWNLLLENFSRVCEFSELTRHDTCVARSPQGLRPATGNLTDAWASEHNIAQPTASN